MSVLENYLSYLSEEKEKKEVTINPQRKKVMSFAALGNPVDDIAAPIAAKLGIKGFGWIKKAGEKAGKFAVQKTGVTSKLGVKAIENSVGLGIGFALGTAGTEGYRLIRSWFDKCTKQCGTFKINDSQRQLCMLKCKKESLEKQILLFRKHKVNPKKINSTIEKLNIVNKKIILYMKYLKNQKNKTIEK